MATGEGIAVVAFIIVLAMARPERKKNPDTDEPPRLPFPWWAKTLAVLVAIAVIVTPFVVLFSKKSRTAITTPGRLTRPGRGADRGGWPAGQRRTRARRGRSSPGW